MNDEVIDDPVLTALAAARPAGADAPADAPTTPAAQTLLAGILATPTAATTPRRTRPRRVRMTAGALSAAAAIVVAVVVVNSVGVDDGRVVVQQQAASADVAAIARASASAFAASGRAELTFDDGRGGSGESKGTSDIAYSGRNLDVSIRFDDAKGAPGFTAHNLTVDGEFYLFDSGRWIHDTTATPKGSGIFDVDPRLLLDVLRPAADFVVVDTTSTPGGDVRHLRATNLHGMPTLALSLGPVDGNDITSLDLWVGPDNTVQRLALTTKHTEAINDTICITQNGVKQCLKPGAKLSNDPALLKLARKAKAGSSDVQIVAGPTPGAVKTRTTTGSYSLRFFDLGADISITAPADAVTVAGKG